MAELSRFFADVAGDRLTTAAQMNRLFDQLLQEKDGVLRGLGNALAVTNAGTLSVDVNTGSAVMGGRLYENTASVNLPLDAVTSGSKRYDRIVVRVDETARTMVLTVIKGVEGASPSVPAIDGTTDVLLAKILIDRSSGSYVYTLTDERAYCNGLLLPAIIAKLNGGTFTEDDIADGTSYRRVQAAMADAINNQTRLPTALGTADANLIGALTKIADAKLFVNAAGNGFEYAKGVKTISTVHDESITGAQSITGVGFKPSWAIVLAYTTDANRFSIGIYDGSNYYCFYQRENGTNGAAAYFVVSVTDLGNFCYAIISSLDSNGITLTWSKVGSPNASVDMLIIFGR